MKNRINREEYIARRQKLADALPENSLLMLFSGYVKSKSWDTEYKFYPDKNYYYMTGLDFPGQILMISKAAGKTETWLFVDRPDPREELYHGHMDTDEEYREGTGIDHVLYHDRFDWQMGRLLSTRNYSNRHFEHLCLDFRKNKFDNEPFPENDMAQKLRYIHPYLEVRDIGPVIDNMRRIKTPEEIRCIREAIRITDLGIRSIAAHLKDGVNEHQLQAWFDFTLESEGAMGNAFEPIIAGGIRSTILHYEDNNQTVQNGELLLLDLGAEYKYYSADISRTLPVGGTFSALQRQYYDAVLYTQDAIFRALRPGLEIEETMNIAQKALFEKCREFGLTDNFADMDRLLPHGVCHFMGLDTHDVGYRGKLEPGMVTTMEPGIYLPEFGFGIRIEDDALITETGAERLSADIPREASAVEGICK